MKSVFLTICLIIISGIAIYSTTSFWNMERAFFGIFIYTFIMTLIVGLLLTIWFEGSFKSKFKKPLRISLPITLLSFLIGYGSILIETLIRK